MTLYELVKKDGGLDIGDNIYDWGNYFDFSDDNCDDYDRCMVEMAKRIEVVKVKTCDIIKGQIFILNYKYNTELGQFILLGSVTLNNLYA